MFWKNHEKLRAFFITLFFILGLVLTFAGWRMTGKLEGLGIMCVGMVFLLSALFIYNAPYSK